MTWLWVAKIFGFMGTLILPKYGPKISQIAQIAEMAEEIKKKFVFALIISMKEYFYSKMTSGMGLKNVWFIETFILPNNDPKTAQIRKMVEKINNCSFFDSKNCCYGIIVAGLYIKKSFQSDLVLWEAQFGYNIALNDQKDNRVKSSIFGKIVYD